MEEFKEYYNNISCTIDRDDYFEQMISTAWRMCSVETRKGETVDL